MSPRRFPGGSIGQLAVHGTVNDLAVSGAKPQWLSAAFVIAEGFAIAELSEIVADMAAAAREAGVALVTGDTKVVPKGAADGLYITTTGVGVIPAGRRSRRASVRPGDRVVLSGTLGDHGMSVMMARGDLDIEAEIESDTAAGARAWSTRCSRPRRTPAGCATRPVAVSARSATSSPRTQRSPSSSTKNCCRSRRWCRAPATCSASIRSTSPTKASSSPSCRPTRPRRRSPRCARTRSAQNAAVIGEIVAEPEGIVALRTPFGGSRIVDMLVGDPLPRIC